jgi:hypothetical protein
MNLYTVSVAVTVSIPVPVFAEDGSSAVEAAEELALGYLPEELRGFAEVIGGAQVIVED